MALIQHHHQHTTYVTFYGAGRIGSDNRNLSAGGMCFSGLIAIIGLAFTIVGATANFTDPEDRKTFIAVGIPCLLIGTILTIVSACLYRKFDQEENKKSITSRV